MHCKGVVARNLPASGRRTVLKFAKNVGNVDTEQDTNENATGQHVCHHMTATLHTTDTTANVTET